MSHPNGPYASFGTVLIELREKRGWNQKKFSDIVGLSQSTVSRYESDGRLPDATILDQMCERAQLDRTEALPLYLACGIFPPETPDVIRDLLRVLLDPNLEYGSRRWILMMSWALAQLGKEHGGQEGGPLPVMVSVEPLPVTPAIPAAPLFMEQPVRPVHFLGAHQVAAYGY